MNLKSLLDDKMSMLASFLRMKKYEAKTGLTSSDQSRNYYQLSERLNVKIMKFLKCK